MSELTGVLSPLALEILERLGAEEAAQELEIGGGIALGHYSPHRGTNDIDAWWSESSEAAREAIRRSVEEVAGRHRLLVTHRAQGSYESWDLKKEGKTVFAFQVARKTRRLEEPVDSPWGWLRVETLNENLANKMTALVTRGAPRDFVDIATVLRAAVTGAELWRLWQAKNPTQPVNAAKASVIKLLNGLEARRPLDALPVGPERDGAQEVRRSIRELCHAD